MRNIVKRTITLILLFSIISVVPAKAQTLVGNENAETIGQTAVTAYVEMPGDSADSDYIQTGDENPAGTYISLLLISMVVIVANGIRVCRKEE